MRDGGICGKPSAVSVWVGAAEKRCICWSFVCIFSGCRTCVLHYSMSRGGAVPGPLVQSGVLLFIF